MEEWSGSGGVEWRSGPPPKEWRSGPPPPPPPPSPSPPCPAPRGGGGREEEEDGGEEGAEWRRSGLDEEWDGGVESRMETVPCITILHYFQDLGAKDGCIHNATENSTVQQSMTQHSAAQHG